MRTITPKILIIYCFCFFSLLKLTYAQVGIGIKTPHSSAVLELKADNKGLLIPRITTANRESLTGAATSLLVFDINQNMFYYFNGGKWYALNEWKTEAASTATPNPVTYTLRGNVGIGTSTASEKLTVAGNATLTGYVSANKFYGGGTIPVGGIIMWNGQYPPSGWALCDGKNNTPDLRAKFVVGLDKDYNTWYYGAIGKTGGEEKHTLTVSEMPSHSHSATAAKNGMHNHTMGTRGFDTGGAKGVDGSNDDTDISSNYDGYHTHTITVANTGGGNSHENRPPYYVIAFIMRTY